MKRRSVPGHTQQQEDQGADVPKHAHRYESPPACAAARRVDCPRRALSCRCSSERHGASARGNLSTSCVQRMPVDTLGR
jgi:hypothetical protein